MDTGHGGVQDGVAPDWGLSFPVSQFVALTAVTVGLENRRLCRYFVVVKTLTVDSQQRVRLPDAKPQSKFVYDNAGNGTIILTEVSVKTQEPFPRGSLTKYLTVKRNKEQLAMLKGCVQGPE